MSRSRKRPSGQGFQHPAQVRKTPLPRVNQAKRARGAVWLGFWLGLIAYLFLSMQQPFGWTLPIWILMAFLVIPGLLGLLIGWKLGPEVPASVKFWAGLKGVFWPMAFYTFLNPVVLLARLEEPDSNGERFLTILLVTVVFGLLAGGVAGASSALTVKRAPKEETV